MENALDKVVLIKMEMIWWDICGIIDTFSLNIPNRGMYNVNKKIKRIKKKKYF